MVPVTGGSTRTVDTDVRSEAMETTASPQPQPPGSPVDDQALCRNGHALEAGHQFCPQCGSPASAVARCSSGHSFDAGFAFCPQCGSPASPGARSRVSEAVPGSNSAQTPQWAGTTGRGYVPPRPDARLIAPDLGPPTKPESSGLRILMPLLVLVPAALLIIGAAIRPWAKLTFSGGTASLDVEVYGVQPWAGLAITAGIAAIVFVLYWAVFRLKTAWLVVLVLLAALGVTAAAVNTVKTHDIASAAGSGAYVDAAGNPIDCISTGDCSPQYGAAAPLALVGGSLLLLVSIPPVLVDQARRSSRRRRDQ